MPNGNFVVTDPLYDEGGIQDVGAVYLFNGNTNVITSSLKGVSIKDSIGNGGITVLDNGNFLVSNPFWDNGSIQNAGAVTWCSGTQGLTKTISSNNSLVGKEKIGFTSGNQVAEEYDLVKVVIASGVL